LLFGAFLFALFFLGCDKSPEVAYYNFIDNLQNRGTNNFFVKADMSSPEGKTRNKTLEDLYQILQEEDNAEDRFAASQVIANNYAAHEEWTRLVVFLNKMMSDEGLGDYASYYLLMTGFAWAEQDAPQTAALYYNILVKNYNDLLIRGQSIHFLALQQLIELETDSKDLAWYYEELLQRFPDKINQGTIWFLLGQAYEQTGNWTGAMRAYTEFLPYYGAVIPGFPDAYNYAKRLVDFNKSPKDWTYESLPALVEAVETVLDAGAGAGPARRLSRIMAKVNFFARTWEQEDDDNSGMVEFNLSDFMMGNRIRYAPELAAGSNATEAYLRTTGWSQYISVWYLYFRKIYFPADPEIHGRWEWAGVYYGEKF
jgi:tetratricopeptide (TPR) repeat protein